LVARPWVHSGGVSDVIRDVVLGWLFLAAVVLVKLSQG